MLKCENGFFDFFPVSLFSILLSTEIIVIPYHNHPIIRQVIQTYPQLRVKYIFNCFFFKILFYLLLERGREGEREGLKHQCMVACYMPPTGDLAHNTGVCPRLGIEPATLWFVGWYSIH